jgi:hypothetical protein
MNVKTIYSQGGPTKHYAVKAVNLPPTEMTCVCGEVFKGDDSLQQMTAHIKACA